MPASTKKQPRAQLGVGCSDIGPREIRYVNQVLKSQRLSYGPFTAKFEQRFAKGHQNRFGIMCNSGTSALRIAVACLKEHDQWGGDSEVLVPAVTFVATSNVLLQQNIRPVFVDVDPKTYNIDPAQMERHITSKTRAIMVVHLFGQPAEMDPIMTIAKKYNLRIIEDSCETMFVNYKGKSVGSFGDISCFSTYIAHLLVTGVGGLALTNNPEYAVTIKSLMNHGRDSIYLSIDDDKTDDPEKLFNVVQRRFKFVRLGYSFRATEMEAALGLAQLERHSEILSARQRNARYLLKKLKPLERYIQLPWWPDYKEHAFMMFPIVIQEPRVEKSDLVFYLEQRQIETRDMLPLINQPIYVKLFGNLDAHYPVAAHINNNGFYIGCHQGLKTNDLDYMADTFFAYFRQKGFAA